MEYLYQLITAPNFQAEFMPALEAYFHRQPQPLIEYVRRHGLLSESHIASAMSTYQADNDWLERTRSNPEYYQSPYLFPEPPDYALYSILMRTVCQDTDIEVRSVALSELILTSDPAEPDPTRKRALDLMVELGPFARGGGDRRDARLGYPSELRRWYGYLTCDECAELQALLADFDSDIKYAAETIHELRQALTLAVQAQQPLTMCELE